MSGPGDFHCFAERRPLCTFRSAAAPVLLRGPANNQTRGGSFRELARGPIDPLPPSPGSSIADIGIPN